MELWDVCDREGNPTGKTKEKDSVFLPGEYHLAAEVWIVNSQGQLLIQQRAQSCQLYPGVWALTAGRVKAGETSRQGCIRELAEELGIRCQAQDVLWFRRIVRTHVIWDLYLLRGDYALDQLILQPEEVAQARWISPDQCRSMMDKGEIFVYPEMGQVLEEVCRLTGEQAHPQP